MQTKIRLIETQANKNINNITNKYSSRTNMGVPHFPYASVLKYVDCVRLRWE